MLIIASDRRIVDNVSGRTERPLSIQTIAGRCSNTVETIWSLSPNRSSGRPNRRIMRAEMSEMGLVGVCGSVLIPITS
jgi:hypothetical protein